MSSHHEAPNVEEMEKIASHEGAKGVLREIGEFLGLDTLPTGEDLDKKISQLRARIEGLDVSGREFVLEILRNQKKTTPKTDTQIRSMLGKLTLTVIPKKDAAPAKAANAKKKAKPDRVGTKGDQSGAEAPANINVDAPADETAVADADIAPTKKESQGEKSFTKPEKINDVVGLIDMQLQGESFDRKRAEDVYESVRDLFYKLDGEFVEKIKGVAEADEAEIEEVSKLGGDNIGDLTRLKRILDKKLTRFARGENPEDDRERIVFINAILGEIDDWMNESLKKSEKAVRDRREALGLNAKPKIEKAPKPKEKKPHPLEHLLAPGVVDSTDPVPPIPAPVADPVVDTAPVAAPEVKTRSKNETRPQGENSLVKLTDHFNTLAQSGEKLTKDDGEMLDRAIASLDMSAEKLRFGANSEKAHLANSKYFNDNIRERFSGLAESLFRLIGKADTSQQIMEGVRNLSDDAETSDKLETLMNSINTLYGYAQDRGYIQRSGQGAEAHMGKPLGEPRAAISGETGFDKEETPEIMVDGIETEATPENPAPTPEAAPESAPEPVKPRATIQDMFLPRDLDSITPEYEKIMADKGFETWIEDHFKYATEKNPHVTLSPESEEYYHERYEKQKPFIEMARIAAESEDIDVALEGMLDEEKVDARKKLFKKWQDDIYHNAENANCLALIEQIKETKEMRDRINTLEAEAAAQMQSIKDNGGNILPEDVYSTVRPTDPNSLRYTEMKNFVDDMSKNFAFYQGHDGNRLKSIDNDNKIKMFRRYAITHEGDSRHGIEKLGRFKKTVAALRAKFLGFGDIDENERKRFGAKVDLLENLRLVRTSHDKVSQETAETNLKYLRLYMPLAENAISHGLNPEAVILDAVTVPKNASISEILEGQKIFRQLYKPYSDLRAMDSDMQRAAMTIEERPAEIKDAYEKVAKGADNLKKDQIMTLVGDENERAEFMHEVQVSVAGQKLRQINASLDKLKKGKSEKSAGLPKMPGEEKAKEQSLADVIAAYAYIQKNVGPEDRLLYKNVTMKLVNRMAEGDGLTPEALRVIGQKESLYEEISKDENISKEKRKEFFTDLIKTLQEKSSKAPLVTKLHLDRIIKTLEKQKENIQ